jgi:hypothetical protein
LYTYANTLPGKCGPFFATLAFVLVHWVLACLDGTFDQVEEIFIERNGEISVVKKK